MLKLIPKTSGDKGAFLMMFINLHFVVLYELFVILPYIDSEWSYIFWAHTVSGLFIYINIMISWYYLITIDTSIHSASYIQTILKPGWSYCHVCQNTAPPRSHHCHICNVCVLRRDHHCVFAGNCVGHKNQRYFCTVLFYLVIGTAYCNYLNFDYTWEVLGGLSWQTILALFFPMMSWLITPAGKLLSFAVCVVASTCLLAFLFLVFLSIYHCRNWLKGSTCPERNVGMSDYDLGFVKNMQQLFGHRWYIAWLSPLIKSNLIGDGSFFETKYKYENIKNL